MQQTQESLTDRMFDLREGISDRFAREQQAFDEADEVLRLQEEIRTLNARTSALENSDKFHESEISELNGAVSLLTAELELLPHLRGEIRALNNRIDEIFNVLMKAVQDATLRGPSASSD